MRPCPLSRPTRSATVASMGNLYAINPVGQVIWQEKLPVERQTKYSFSVRFLAISYSIRRLSYATASGELPV